MSTAFSFENIYNNELKIFKILSDDTLCNIVLKKSILILLYIMLTLFIVCNTIHTVYNSSLKTFSENLMYCAAFWCAYLATLYILKFRQEFFKIFIRITTPEIYFIPRNVDEMNFIKNYLRNYKILKTSAGCVGFSSLVVMCTITFEQNQYMPASLWYPFDISYSPIYVMADIHQSICLYCIGSFDIFFWLIVFGFTSFIKIQCNLINYYLIDLPDGEKTLKTIVKKHQELLK